MSYLTVTFSTGETILFDSRRLDTDGIAIEKVSKYLNRPVVKIAYFSTGCRGTKDRIVNRPPSLI